MGDSRLAELARRHGVATAYEDVWGERHEASDATLRAVLAAMHVDATGAAQIEAAIAGHEYARRAQTLPAALVVRVAALADMEHDGPGFEQHETVFFEDRYLPEGLQRAIIRFVLVALLEQARPVGQAGLLQRPARAQIAHLTLGEIWNPFESGDRDHVVCSLAIVVIPTDE